ncbi:hypothetical protein [Actinomadura sp. 7K507]|uniref:hypothetical protein n=1 Tax=Actinomadura sp. 7K507 TaxID=2530365 RepID=UPI001044479B|nr:hypothetical protein [Actinomadura sp. 7K507]TDC85840.1 hypothetical protein E1285_24460 [Actinomadura sp. 7K507]
MIATGYRNDMTVLPGLEPANGVHTITTLQDAVEAGAGWRRFLDSPGPIVIGAAQGAGCFGAAYEFLFNTAYQLKKAGLKKRVPLTYVTAEPFLGHFGIGGLPGGECLLKLFCKKEGIQAVTGTAMAEASPGKLLLDDGGALDFAYAMVIPPFLGQHVIAATAGLADGKGFVPVRDAYQSIAHPSIYAVGVAAAVTVPWATAIPVGIPKTGFPTEVQARVAAANIAARIRGEQQTRHKELRRHPRHLRHGRRQQRRHDSSLTACSRRARQACSSPDRRRTPPSSPSRSTSCGRPARVMSACPDRAGRLAANPRKAI